ncbi:MAG TPA: hypothetical protein VFV38_48845 [Ktedonobacteraceae bacterium]|nr:hypothetical protein [Ktedonobacteraceae bacterium]
MVKAMYPAPPGPSEGPIVYDTTRIWETGQQIVKDAAAAQQAHDAYVRDRVNPYLPTALRTIESGSRITQHLLRAHVDRLGMRNASASKRIGSYDWQLQMGNTLKFIAAGIDEQESNWSNSFKGKVPR